MALASQIVGPIPTSSLFSPRIGPSLSSRTWDSGEWPQTAEEATRLRLTGLLTLIQGGGGNLSSLLGHGLYCHCQWLERWSGHRCHDLGRVSLERNKLGLRRVWNQVRSWFPHAQSCSVWHVWKLLCCHPQVLQQLHLVRIDQCRHCHGNETDTFDFIAAAASRVTGEVLPCRSFYPQYSLRFTDFRIRSQQGIPFLNPSWPLTVLSLHADASL